MLVRKSREFTVNMGNYESVKIGASVELDTKELSKHPEKDMLAAANEFADNALEKVLAEDIKEAASLTNTRDSFILSWNKR